MAETGGAPPQEHRAEAAGQPEGDPGGQAAELADHQGAVRIVGQAQLDIQRMHAGTTAAARHEQGAVIGDRAATGLQRPLSLGVGQAIATGLGPWGQVQSIVAGNTLTVNQLLACSSLRKGFASTYDEVDLPGVNRPQGAGNGSTKITASGFLADGTSFQFEWVDMGKKDGNGQDFVRHVRIAFK